MNLTLGQGKALVQFARKAIEGKFTGIRPKAADELLSIMGLKRGVFVTLHEGGALRGCIGFPEPVEKLGTAIEKSAHGAAFEDPRFPNLRETELTRVVVEVSVLTEPRLIKVSDPEALAKHIPVGRVGLIAERGNARGLLLPQVPVEQGWDSQEFLEHTCMKAGLMMDAYKKKGFNLYIFEAQIFTEVGPEGEVVSRKIR